VTFRASGSNSFMAEQAHASAPCANKVRTDYELVWVYEVHVVYMWVYMCILSVSKSVCHGQQKLLHFSQAVASLLNAA
jgi:hypothetical protein